MGDCADQWRAQERRNLWGVTPRVLRLPLEGGAAEAVQSSLQAGCLTTGCTAGPGLLLMLPQMIQIADQSLRCVFHVAARTVANSAGLIFGDYSDLVAAQWAGWAMLFGASVQEAHDLAFLSQMATLDSGVPFLHVFDGFRTSHEQARISLLTPSDMLALLPEYAMQRQPVAADSKNCADLLQRAMERFALHTGRVYHAYQYVGDARAERVIVAMGSACQTIAETVEALNLRGESVGLLLVRLFRPLDTQAMLRALPQTCSRLAVLDRCAESGTVAEPLYEDLVAVLAQDGRPMHISGGRYGLANHEFTPAMVAAVFAELAKPAPRARFTVGLGEDEGPLSLSYDRNWILEDPESVRAILWCLGSDGSLQDSLRILGEATDQYAQGYFVSDSDVTVAHLRFGPRPLRKPYLIQRASFVAVHQFALLTRFAVLDSLECGGTVLLNCPFDQEEVWERLPGWFRRQVLDQKLEVYGIDAQRLALDLGLEGIDLVMQISFFYLSGVVSQSHSMSLLKEAWADSGLKTAAAIDAVCENLRAVPIGPSPRPGEEVPPPDNRSKFLVTQRALATSLS